MRSMLLIECKNMSESEDKVLTKNPCERPKIVLLKEQGDFVIRIRTTNTLYKKICSLALTGVSVTIGKQI